MKKVLFLFVLLLLQNELFADVKFYNYSTLNVGPGVVHKKIIAPTVPWTLNVLEVDLTNPYIAMESVKANDRIYGMERTSSMASRKDTEGHRIVGAVNGDFYNTANGEPLTVQLINGEMLKNPIDWWSIAFSETNRPDIGKVLFSGTVTAKSATGMLHGVNKVRSTDQLILYNSYIGGSTGTNIYGTEVLLRPLSDWIVNDTVACTVEAVDNDGNMIIPKGQAVLSGHGAAAEFISSQMVPGDTIKLVQNLKPSLPRLKQLVGANVKLLENGVYSAGSNTAIHPRTAAGFSADSTRLFLVTVDGRQPGSRGMSYRELADFMKNLGAAQAVNLDGGGSTTMYVLGNVENSPSDVAGERTVSNALMAVSSAPAGDLRNIQISPDNVRVFLKNSIEFKTGGWDEYYHKHGITLTQLDYSVDENLGTIDEKGVFTAAGNVDSGYVYVSFNGLKDSAYVYIKSIGKIELSPGSIVADTIQTVQFYVKPTDVDALIPSINLGDYDWESLDQQVGTINGTGLFKGNAEGTARVVARFKDQLDTAQVIVQIGEDTAVLDSMNSAEKWLLSGENYEADSTILSVVDSPSTIGSGALCLDYKFIRNADARSWIFLDTFIPVYGLPDTIKIDIKSDMKKHIADLVVSDDNDERFSGSSGIFSKTSQEYETYNFVLANFNQVEPGSRFNFPIIIKSLKIKLGYSGPVGQVNKGSLFIDNLRAVYPNVTTAIPLRTEQMPRSLKLYQNYPNPFNPETTIKFETRKNGYVQLTVFDLLGREVTQLVSDRLNAGRHRVTWKSASQASGMYIYCLESAGQLVSKKLLILK